MFPETSDPVVGEERVPLWLRHLFWNANVHLLDLRRDAAYIAGRLLASDDAQAHAWVAATLPSEAFLQAARMRGVSARRAALARNLTAVLPPPTRQVWRALVGNLPRGAYLVGGTGIAAHLGHRASRDLGFFVGEPFEPEELARGLEMIDKFAPTQIAAERSMATSARPVSNSSTPTTNTRWIRPPRSQAYPLPGCAICSPPNSK